MHLLKLRVGALLTVAWVCRVTGRGYMDVNRISGYIPGKMVFFLMQVLSRLQCTSLFSHRLSA